MEVFREKVSHFSLDLRQIRPSAGFGTRRGNVLRGEGFTWVPDLGSFFKLLEVVFSPYLGFIPIFSTFRMFRLIEALNGRLIGPKAWDRIDLIYGTQCEELVTVGMGYLGVGCVDCVLNGCLVCIGLGMAVDCGFTR